MADAFICSPLRTAIGRHGGSLSALSIDELAAKPLQALVTRNPGVDWAQVDDLIMGHVHLGDECGGTLARKAALAAGLPVHVPGTVINRLSGAGMDAVAMAARAVKSRDAQIVIAAGAESMSRLPASVPLGGFGLEAMTQAAETVAARFKINRKDQDAFAYRSQRRATMAQVSGLLAAEMVPLVLEQASGEPRKFHLDESARASTSVDGLAQLPAILGEGATITLGNSAGYNDGACAMLVASEAALNQHNIQPMVRVVAMAAAGSTPDMAGIAAATASRKVLANCGLTLEQMDLIELHESFAATTLAVIRQLGLPDDAGHVNANGGAIAIGDPMGMSGARLITTAAYQLQRVGGRFALCAMPVGLGQGVAMIIESI